MNYFSGYEHQMSRVLAFNYAVLVTTLVFPAGSYVAHGVSVKVSSFSSPFADYGVFLATSAIFVSLFAIAARLYGRRRGVTPLGYVLVSGWVLGFMVPDIITSGNRTIAIGTDGRLVQVQLLAGFWLTLSVASLLLAVASTAYFAKSNARNLDQRESPRGVQSLD